jgi:hypothetical protein
MTTTVDVKKNKPLIIIKHVNIAYLITMKLIAYFPLIRHKLHKKRRVQQFFYCCLCIRCRSKVFTELLPSNIHRQSDGRDL